jgi:chorismate mutase/prephenate dehydrogenase
MSSLDVLRAQMQEVDRQILQLVARRLELAQSIGQAKRNAGLPLRDYDVERQVLERAAQLAAGAGVAPDLSRALLQLLIAESCVRQERDTYADYRGEAENIHIVGAQGKMGRWFADFFGNQGHDVTSSDIADAGDGRSPAERTRTASYVLLATPLDRVPDSITEAIESSGDAVVFDIASLKGHLKPAIAAARARGARITSIHPLFGPSTRTLSDKVICICDCGDADATASVERLFSDTAATLVRLSLDEHDRIMASVLGLSHLINLLFTRTLMSGGVPFERLNRVGSTTFHSQMVTTATVIRDNPELYYAIQKLNPFTPELYATLRRELDGLIEAVDAGDEQRFVASMRECYEWMERS